MVNAGLAMATMDLIGMLVWACKLLDVVDCWMQNVETAFRIILKDPNVKAIFD
jgi:succinyl-CoA synthetase beta subunit